MEMRLGDYFCLLNHRPVYPTGIDDPFRDSDKAVNYDRYTFILSGHIHEKRLWTGKSLNVGVDKHGFRPLSLHEEVKALLDARHKELCQHTKEVLK
jgi:calcineurin-like phosphoesterase family protein